MSTGVKTAAFGNARHLKTRKNHRVSIREESLTLAKEFAEDWYLPLRANHLRLHLTPFFGWRRHMPDLSARYRSSTKVSHRA